MRLNLEELLLTAKLGLFYPQIEIHSIIKPHSNAEVKLKLKIDFFKIFIRMKIPIVLVHIE